jgi:hypothetical protein
VQALITLFICALGTLAYVRLQGWENPWDGFMDRIALLLVFVVLALVTGSVILARTLAFMVSFNVHTI